MGTVTYVSLNLGVMLALWCVARRYIRETAWLYRVIALHLIGMTLVFDPMIVGLGIVDYDTTKILGVRVFGAPVEDFCYAIVTVFLIPALWRYLGKEQHEKRSV